MFRAELSIIPYFALTRALAEFGVVLFAAAFCSLVIVPWSNRVAHGPTYRTEALIYREDESRDDGGISLDSRAEKFVLVLRRNGRTIANELLFRMNAHHLDILRALGASGLGVSGILPWRSVSGVPGRLHERESLPVSWIDPFAANRDLRLPTV